MMKLLGPFAWLAVVAGIGASPTHEGSADPALEEEIEASLGDPLGISLPEVQVVRFLGQHFPEMLGELEGVESGDAEARKKVLDRARGLILEWEEHFRVGEEVAGHFIEVERLHYKNDGLVGRYVKMEEGAEKAAAGEELRKNLSRIHDLRVEMEKAELTRLKEEIAAIEENLKDSGANRETMVERELRDLLEFWRLEKAGLTADRAREEPFIPAEVLPPAPEGSPVPTVPEVIGAPGERIELARPVEGSESGGFVERKEEGKEGEEKEGAEVPKTGEE